MINWRAWELDVITVGWLLWLVFFFAWETIGIRMGSEHTLTHHLRPIFHASPPTWYIGVALWLWMGPHFFFPGLEETLAKLVST